MTSGQSNMVTGRRTFGLGLVLAVVHVVLHEDVVERRVLVPSRATFGSGRKDNSEIIHRRGNVFSVLTATMGPCNLSSP